MARKNRGIWGGLQKPCVFPPEGLHRVFFGDLSVQSKCKLQQGLRDSPQTSSLRSEVRGPRVRSCVSFAKHKVRPNER